MTKQKMTPELSDYLSALYDNMRDMLATAPRRPGFTTPLEYINLSGENYFPSKTETLGLKDKAVDFFNAAAVYIQAEGPKRVHQALPKNAPANIDKALDEAGLYNIAQLTRNYAR